jgi:predicted dienelactone hydrolase
MRRTRLLATSVACLATLALSLAGCRTPDPGPGPGPTDPTTPTTPGPTQPGGGGFQKGPDPTNAALLRNGPFSVQQSAITGASGFGGGRVYVPSEAGTYGAIAISPGFTARWSSLSWLGPRLASHGFVVLGMETNTTGDFPPSRGSQLNAALRWLTSSSSARTKVDGSRLAVGGHSMGGGGTLSAMQQNPALKLGVPIAPWHSTKSWSSVRAPVVIVSGSADAIASEGSHADRFYSSLGSSEKAQVSITGGSHFFPQTTNGPLSFYAIAWLKRFVDNDTRYSSFACSTNGAGGSYTFRSTCPV